MHRLLRSSGEVVLLALKESWMVVVEMDGLWWSNHLLVGGAVLSHILVPTDHHPENTNTKPNERRPPGLGKEVNHQDICPLVTINTQLLSEKDLQTWEHEKFINSKIIH